MNSSDRLLDVLFLSYLSGSEDMQVRTDYLLPAREEPIAAYLSQDQQHNLTAMKR